MKIARIHIQTLILKDIYRRERLQSDTDDSNLPSKMLRLLNMEYKSILPHQEVTEVINLVADDEKEVKIGTSLDPSTKKEIIDLLHEYVDIFA